MNKLLMITIMMLLTMSVAVLATEYVTVVGRDAPTSDVITAANFAGSMTGLGLTFTGAIDTEFIKENPTLNNYYLVVIDGQDIRLIGSTQYNTQITNYFEEQNFQVQKITNPTLADIRITPEEIKEETTTETVIVVEENVTVEENITAAEPEEQCMGCEYEGACLAQGTTTNGYYCDGLELQTLKSQGAVCSQNYECEEGSCSKGTCAEEKRNVLVRVLSWFANIF